MKRYIWFVDFRKTIQERVASCRAPKSLVKLLGDGSIPVEFKKQGIYPSFESRGWAFAEFLVRLLIL